MAKGRLIVAMLLWVMTFHFTAHSDDLPQPSEKNREAVQTGEERRAERKREQIEREIVQLMEVSQWYAHDSVRIDSPEFAAAVKKLSSNPPLMVPTGATAIPRESFTTVELQDLGLAIGSLMQAYATPGLDSNLAYVEDRGEKLDSMCRLDLERFLRRKNPANLEEFTDRDFLLHYGHVAKLRNVWAGFVPESSCLAIWDGRTIPTGDPRKFHFIQDDGHLPTSEDEALLARVQPIRTIRHMFIPRQGTLDEALVSEKPVPVCEVKLVIEYEPQWSKSRAIYLCRFWLNRAEGKWQPLTLHCFSDPRVKNSFPSLLF